MELPSVGTTRARRKLRPRGLARGEPRSNGTQPRRANSGNSHLRGGLGSGLRVAQTTRVRSTHPSRNCTLLPPRFHSLRLVADFLFPPTHTVNVDSWTLFFIDYRWCSSIFRDSCAHEVNRGLGLEPIVLYGGLTVSIESRRDKRLSLTLTL